MTKPSASQLWRELRDVFPVEIAREYFHVLYWELDTPLHRYKHTPGSFSERYETVYGGAMPDDWKTYAKSMYRRVSLEHIRLVVHNYYGRRVTHSELRRLLVPGAREKTREYDRWYYRNVDKPKRMERQRKYRAKQRQASSR